MDVVFLDANVLFSAACHPGSDLSKLWKMRDVSLVSSLYAAEEARRNLAKPEQRTRLEEMLRSVKLVSALPIGPLPEGVKLPAKDIPILLAAVSARATHLLTGDIKHFGPYFERVIGGVTILPPALYFKRKVLD